MLKINLLFLLVILNTMSINKNTGLDTSIKTSIKRKKNFNIYKDKTFFQSIYIDNEKYLK